MQLVLFFFSDAFPKYSQFSMQWQKQKSPKMNSSAVPFSQNDKSSAEIFLLFQKQTQIPCKQNRLHGPPAGFGSTKYTILYYNYFAHRILHYTILPTSTGQEEPLRSDLLRSGARSIATSYRTVLLYAT